MFRALALLPFLLAVGCGTPAAPAECLSTPLHGCSASVTSCCQALHGGEMDCWYETSAGAVYPCAENADCQAAATELVCEECDLCS